MSTSQCLRGVKTNSNRHEVIDVIGHKSSGHQVMPRASRQTTLIAGVPVVPGKDDQTIDRTNESLIPYDSGNWDPLGVY